MFLAAVIAAAFADHADAAPITYTFGNTFTSPYFDVNVSITTDGALGPITPANVLSWSFLVHTYNGRTYQQSSTSPDTSIYFASLVATNADLLYQLPPPPLLTPPQSNQGEIFNLSGPNVLYPYLHDTLRVLWAQQSDGTSVSLRTYWSLYDFSDTREYGNIGVAVTIPPDGLVKIPEPSTLALAAFGAVALLAVRRRHSAR